jgi:catechol 2,3-dioxygenase
MIKAGRLGHLVLNVSDLEAALDFYGRAVGLEVVSKDAERKIAFMSLGEQHHDLALVERATGAPPGDDQPGLVHMAWQLDDFAALQAAHDELADAGIELDPVQHNITNSLYMRDPDGHVVELYCDRWAEEEGLEVLRTQGPKRVALDMATGVAADEEQELLRPNL